MKQLVKQTLLSVAHGSYLIRKVAAFIVDNTSVSHDTYGYLKEKFINNKDHSDINESGRSEIVSRFERIDREVPIGSTPTDGLFLAEMMLNMEAEGVIVECGCYRGGSSAKLSIISKLLGRKLIIFDSFEGLPAVE